MRLCPKCSTTTQEATCPTCGVPTLKSLGAPPADPRIGTDFQARYRIDCAIGAGSMGTVYQGYEARKERSVAIKILSPQSLPDRGAHAIWNRLMRSIERFRHPNLVRILDHGISDAGEPFVVTELLKGCSLTAAIARDGALDLATATEVGAKVASALAAAHADGVLHRDIEPSNIYLVRSGQGGRTVKLLDLGLTQFAFSTRYAHRLAQRGQLLGTADYQPPELILGKEASAASDLYMLGAVLYEAITGAPPFGHGSPTTILYKHVKEAPPPLERHVPGIPQALDRLVLWMLDKAPERRPNDASEVARLLRTCLQGGQDVLDKIPVPPPPPKVEPAEVSEDEPSAKDKYRSTVILRKVPRPKSD
jgi:serine/threonine-protein kinase